MARIRTIKPEFWTDSIIVRLPIVTRLFYIGLWNIADDYGLLWDEPDRIEMQLFPRDPTFHAEEHLALLEACGRIEMYVCEDGRRFWKIAHWEQHQKVDHPGKCLFPREDSRKLAIPAETRRAVATKYGCTPGESCSVQCYYCGNPGRIVWHRHYSGEVSAWVTFPGMELDHFVPEDEGGAATRENMVLACRGCNRSKGTKDAISYITLTQFASTREGSRLNGKEKEKDTEVDGERESTRTGRPTLEQCTRLAVMFGGTEAQGEKIFWHYEGHGWPSNGLGIRVDAIIKKWLLGDAERELSNTRGSPSRSKKTSSTFEPWMVKYGQDHGLTEQQMAEMDWAPVAKERRRR